MTFTMKAVLWFVVLIGLAAVVSAVVIGAMHRDVEVEDEPYEAGLRFDEDRDRISGLGWRTSAFIVRHRAGETDIRLLIRDGDGNPAMLGVGEVRAVASRPAGDLDDVPCSAEVPREGPLKGEIRALCAPLAFGHWDFVVNITTDSGPVKFVERTYVKKKSH
jgi:hypothetical protein